MKRSARARSVRGSRTAPCRGSRAGRAGRMGLSSPPKTTKPRSTQPAPGWPTSTRAASAADGRRNDAHPERLTCVSPAFIHLGAPAAEGELSCSRLERGSIIMASHRDEELTQARSLSRECIARSDDSMRYSDEHIVRSRDAVARSLELLRRRFHGGVEDAA